MTPLLHENLLARTRQSSGPSPPAAPPRVAPPTPSDTQWPRAARLTVVGLALAALVAALGVAAVIRADDADLADRDEQIATLTNDLTDTTARVGGLTAERDELQQQLTAAVSERAALEDEIAELTAVLVAADAEVADLEARLDAANDLTATLDERIAALDVRADELVDRATTAEQQRDALLRLFPIEFASSLHGVDITGTWKLAWTTVHCNGLTTCGTLPSFDRITIAETAQGWLRVRAAGVFDAGLFDVEGARYAIAESRSAAPACGTVPRSAHVGLTLYAHDVRVTVDGEHHVDDLAATYVVDAPATGACPAGLAVYTARLTPVG